MSKRMFKVNIQYTNSMGYNTATGMHADTLKQAIGLCNWYAVEVAAFAGTIHKSEVMICNEHGLPLKSIVVL